MVQIEQGFPENFVNDPVLDYYTLSNEDIDLTATLEAGVSDVHQFAIPFPADMDLDSETIDIHAIEFLYLREQQTKSGTEMKGLLAYLSYLPDDFVPAFRGNVGDTNDEAWKSQFAGPYFFGDTKFCISAAASVEGVQREADTVLHIKYIPIRPLPMFTPIFCNLVNNSTAITLATNAVVDGDFDAFERVSLRIWYKIRKLSRDEQVARNVAMRFMRKAS